MGSVVLTTQGQTITASRWYRAYGAKRSGNDFTFEQNYTGQRLDDTGLLYYGARYYDPAAGRFLSPDTLVPDPNHPLDYNRYLYARGNPLKYNDPTGHCVASIFSPGSAATIFDAACWTMVEATSTATAVAALPLVGAVALMGGVIAGIPLTTDGLPAYPPPITGQEQGQIIESFPLPGATTLTIDGVPLVQQAGNGIHGIQPETPTALISTWIGSNPRGVHTRDGFERATTDLPGGLAAAEKFFEQYAGRLPDYGSDRNSRRPSDRYILDGEIEVYFRPNSGSGTPVIEIKDYEAKTYEKIHFNP